MAIMLAIAVNLVKQGLPVAVFPGPFGKKFPKGEIEGVENDPKLPSLSWNQGREFSLAARCFPLFQLSRDLKISHEPAIYIIL